MINHLENIEQLLCYTLKEIDYQQVINILYAKISQLVENYVNQRDLENLISYFKFVLSARVVPKKLKLDIKLVHHFVYRTYAGFDEQTQEIRVDKLYEFLKNKIGDGAEINDKNLKILESDFNEKTMPDFEKLKERVLIALLLKWLQGPLREKLSDGLNGYVIFLATTFGQYETNRILNLEKELHDISKDDLETLAIEYDFLETALMDAIEVIRKSKTTGTENPLLCSQFRVIFLSLDNLSNKIQQGKMDELSSFRDRIIVATALIYLQDDLVEKNDELKNLINLFVSLYYQFRDKRD